MDRLRVDSFELRTVSIADVHPDKLHALSMTVGWRYHANEWCFLRQCGHGIAALDEIDRVVATAMVFPFSDGFATLGMVIVSPRLQGQGVAPWLVRQLICDFPGATFRLNATGVARRVFQSLGFAGEAEEVHLYRGKVRPMAEPTAFPRKKRIERLSAADVPAVIDADCDAFGVSRADVMRHLLARNVGYGLFEGARLKAFAIRRAAGRGHIVGPVVAENTEDAVAVVRRHLADLPDQSVRLDTPCDEGPFTDFLVQSGLAVFETLTTMAGPAPVTGRYADRSGQVRIFALVGPSLG